MLLMLMNMLVIKLDIGGYLLAIHESLSTYYTAMLTGMILMFHGGVINGSWLCDDWLYHGIWQCHLSMISGDGSMLT